MPSIGKLVAGAEDYYLSMLAEGKEEHYAGAGESPGAWTDDLDLAGRISREASPSSWRASPRAPEPISACRSDRAPRRVVST
jgi:hypothetical protein